MIAPLGALAGIMHVNSLYYSDAMSAGSETKANRLQWDAGIGVELGPRKNYLIQIVYGSFNSTDEVGSVTKTYAGTDMGINFGYQFGSKKSWIVDAAYMFISKVKYSDGSGTEVEWRGTALKADFGYQFWLVDELLALGLKIFYYAPTFTEEISTTTLTQVSYKRTVIYPGVSLLWNF